jgi:hypothetical protein
MLHALFIGTIIDTAKRYNSFLPKIIHAIFMAHHKACCKV